MRIDVVFVGKLESNLMCGGFVRKLVAILLCYTIIYRLEELNHFTPLSVRFVFQRGANPPAREIQPHCRLYGGA